MGRVIARVRLRAGRAKPVWAGHPRVMSGAVAGVEDGEPGAGDTVLVTDHSGKPIGRGFYAPKSPVRVRMLTLDSDEEIDEAFFRRRIARAVAHRVALGLPSESTDAYRLVHGHGDGLPGMVADRYGDIAVVQLSVRGMEDRRELIAGLLAESAGLTSVHLRAAGGIDAAEGLCGIEGPLTEAPVPGEVRVRENGISYLVDPVAGQKTGHFADHRENRARWGDIVRGARVLDAFTGTGGFALAAARGGAAAVHGVDSSTEALERAGRNAELNGFGDRIEFVRGDVFRHLRSLLQAGDRYEAVCLDPPRMASRRKELGGALRGYKELNLRAMRLLGDGGILATASCTGLLSEDAFLRMLRDAALDAKRRLTVQFTGGQGPDHPWTPTAPEGRYLKFLVARVS